ncbi:hypothetical protein AJ88_23780 [Mesorhizobium amorphae CCBAU 01583]|nr:hypothetical protein AJ88_23780 [Mesorhizobium amorphae CCBAU 01583]
MCDAQGPAKVDFIEIQVDMLRADWVKNGSDGMGALLGPNVNDRFALRALPGTVGDNVVAPK